ncbi:O-antigen ligase family protein [Acaryochloris sp. IP29b_bin.137]|uniref:O-antigen ligase family protein n=1 Tax=Acaryochloris sp. IP29b_bin.137 TaxID=2969217 RepID=UPI00260B5878|nr:O-antigen ligase family protein [Acaryochloris sp. IP29b_bin.137]
MTLSSDSQFDDLNPSPADQVAASSRSLLGILCLGLYTLFTLMPDSHSLMVAWPWVLVWQLTWLCPILWLAGQLWQRSPIPRLQQGLDWLVALTAAGLLLSTIWAIFPNQARWYTGAALGGIAALYCITAWSQSPIRRQRLLVTQGIVSVGFIVTSLLLWTTQTLWPELNRLQTLQQAGIQASYNFSTLELRNWAPFGHQNYVAGYLVMALPLLFGLGLTHPRWRWWWFGSFGLGLVDLYTTSSRGGWLGFLVAGLYLGLALFRQKELNWRWLIGGTFAGLGIVLVLVLANNRLSSQVSNLLQGRSGGDMAYRLITHIAGWKMGNQQPITGMGAGSVPLAYQAYRPDWAGLEAEHAYQLHGTLAQIWAELGIVGIVPLILLFGWLLWQGWRQITLATAQANLLPQSLLAGLLGYGLVSLTDYQLDNIGISGFILINLGCLASFMRPPREASPANRASDKHSRKAAGILLGMVVACGISVVPVHAAWQLSSQGFLALNQQDLNLFRQRLGDAQAKTPWEPYYSYQLGWNLGEIGLKTQDPKLRNDLIQTATQHFIQGNQVAPDQEFGHTNLGWLYLQTAPRQATQAFARSAELVPAKRGVFFGLGLSLLGQGQTDLAVQAMTLECLRNPIWITSPVWKSSPLKSIYDQVLANLKQNYDELVQGHQHLPELNTHFHQGRGSLQWWRGNFEAAQADLNVYGSPLSQTLLRVATSQPGDSIEISPQLSNAPRNIIQAWVVPDQRSSLVAKAWLMGTSTTDSTQLVNVTLDSMQKARTFQEWLQDYPIVRQYHRQRAGFGVLSRHTDGPNPTDFFRVIDNVVMTEILSDMMPVPVYFPDLDRALQERRNALLSEVKALSENAMLTSSLIQSGAMD